MSTTVIDTLSWCKHNVFASSMMQMQCICIIMTILESSSLMFTTSIQVYNTMSFVFVHRSRWHTLCFQVHWSSRVAGPAERPGIHKVHGLPSPAPTLESALVRLWSYQWAPLQHPSGFSTKRSTPGGRVNTKSSPLYPWYYLPGNGQHWRFWCPLWTVWPIQEKWPLLMAKQCFCVRYY